MIFQHNKTIFQADPMAAWVCGLLVARIAGSNTAGDMAAFIL